MDFSRFDANRRLYGRCSSWAVWDMGRGGGASESDAEGRAFSFTVEGHEMVPVALNRMVRTLQEVSDQESLDALGLNPDIVLLALNFSERTGSRAFDAAVDSTFAEDYDGVPAAYCAFHEEARSSSDHRLRKAVHGTGVAGAYITDLVKFDGDTPSPVRVSRSEDLDEKLKDPTYVMTQVRGLVRELESLGSVNPTIVAMGGVTQRAMRQTGTADLLKEGLGPDTRVINAVHYSKRWPVKDEVYVARFRQQLAPWGLID